LDAILENGRQITIFSCRYILITTSPIFMVLILFRNDEANMILFAFVRIKKYFKSLLFTFISTTQYCALMALITSSLTVC
jgi:hypothetical protein